MSVKCRHRNDSSITKEYPNHKWASDRGYRDLHVIWVVCPRKFGKAVARNEALWKWAIDGFQEPLLWSDILLVLSPDPGCEL